MVDIKHLRIQKPPNQASTKMTSPGKEQPQLQLHPTHHPKKR